jgi:hypothetical protein
MNYPLDFGIQKHIFRNTTTRLLTIIHDGNRHPGDLWPTTKALRSRAKNSDALIFFSDYVMSKFSYLEKTKYRIPLGTRENEKL